MLEPRLNSRSSNDDRVLVTLSNQNALLRYAHHPTLVSHPIHPSRLYQLPTLVPSHHSFSHAVRPVNPLHQNSKRFHHMISMQMRMYRRSTSMKCWMNHVKYVPCHFHFVLAI